MKLYTCGQGDHGASIGHPCGRAAKALADAGHEPELQMVAGYRLLPWTRRGDIRAEVERLSGQRNVPILVLDDGDVVSGSGAIVRWAKGHPAPAAH